ncbi:MAG: hypothetical protein ABNH00_04170 [Dokdonia sp.]
MRRKLLQYQRLYKNHFKRFIQKRFPRSTTKDGQLEPSLAKIH